MVSSKYDKHETKAWIRGSKKRKKPSSKDDLTDELAEWQERLAGELHKPIRPNFTRRRVIVIGIDEIWASDLVEMQKFS